MWLTKTEVLIYSCPFATQNDEVSYAKVQDVVTSTWAKVGLANPVRSIANHLVASLGGFVSIMKQNSKSDCIL